MPSKKNRDLSIVIPAYNEADKIEADIKAADAFLRENKFIGEIIVVDDGSEDNTREIAALNKGRIFSELILISFEKNRGKGAAVREGILLSRGEFVLYADAGSTIPFTDVLKGIKMIKAGECDLANASRKLKESVIVRGYGPLRRLLSSIFLLAAKKLFRLPGYLTDTQCGFKVMPGKIAGKIFSRIKLKGYLFEIEVILLADREGYEIKEFPVSWSRDPQSSLGVFKSAPSIITELFKLWRNRKTW
jgi:dolichyl-phosphate beta-glucosyltransferase